MQQYFKEISAKARRTWKSENKLNIDDFDSILRGEIEHLRYRQSN